MKMMKTRVHEALGYFVKKGKEKKGKNLDKSLGCVQKL